MKVEISVKVSSPLARNKLCFVKVQCLKLVRFGHQDWQTRLSMNQAGLEEREMDAVIKLSFAW